MPGIKPMGYADDGMFLIQGMSPDILIDLAQPAIDLAVQWGRENGLVFSPKKTQVILFRRKNKLEVEGNLYINGSKLPFLDEVCYLGLTLNRKLNWNTHVIKKINKCKGKLCSLRSALGVRWGPSPRILLWAFESLVVPSLTYGAMVWGHTSLNKSTLDKLRQLNRLAACLTSSVRRTTPSAGLEVILGLKPLELVAMESGLLDSLRWVPKIKWDGLGTQGARGHVWTWSHLGHKLGLGTAIPDRSGLRCFNWDPPCSLVDDFVLDKDTLVCAVFTENLDNSIRFTSLFEGCGLTGQVSQQCIVYGQDLYCLYRGFEVIIGALNHLVGGGERVVILSKHRPSFLQQPVVRDLKTSTLLSTMKALAERTGKKILLSNNKPLLGRYFTVFQEGVGVDWSHVSSHTALLSKQVIKRMVKKWGNDRWQAQWVGLTTCQQTKIWFPSIRGDFTSHIRRLERHDLSHLIHFTTGHNFLLRHRRKLTGEGTDLCRLCGVAVEDALHLWVACPATKSLKDEGVPARDPITWSPSQLCRFLKEPTIAKLLDQDGLEHLGDSP